ncbi:MAG: hypothetical protein FJ286_10255 [Planctomycetes bacterium]|nr:hypothetical protein [Planctomycetota bacterium]
MSMPAYTSDTADDAAAVQLRCFRELAPAERIRKACVMSRQNRLMAMEAIRRRHPGLAEDDVQLAYIELAYGGELAAEVRRWRQGRGA